MILSYEQSLIISSMKLYLHYLNNNILVTRLAAKRESFVSVTKQKKTNLDTDIIFEKIQRRRFLISTNDAMIMH